MLNQGQYQLPEPPKLADFDQSLQDYKAQVQAEIAQEAAAAGMTVEEYAAAGYEAPQQDTFSIYQLRGGEETRDYRFEPYERLQAAGLAVDSANYDLVYTAPLDKSTSLEDIYRTFNIDHPADFRGHSLSVSDVVVLHQNGQDTAHYVDSFGYMEVPEFLRENPCVPPNCLRSRTKT
ncbi:YodL domain-containing protein [Enterococcus faecium]